MAKHRKSVPSLLDNAIDSISLGLDDLRKAKSNPKRLVSCVRNLYAGVLLLFKQRLVELSPEGSDEILIKREFKPVIGPGGDVIFKGCGKRTIEYHEIQTRLVSLDIPVDWTRMNKIRGFRNEVEHYHSPLSEKAVRGLIADVFLVVRNFMKLQLKKDPARTLGRKDWQTLLDAHDVFEKEKKVCVQRMDKLTWSSEILHEAMVRCTCESCNSSLIGPEEIRCDASATEYVCRSCQKRWSFEEIAEKAAIDFYGGRNFEARRHGGDPATVTCPSCNLDTYDLGEDVCLVCGESAPRVCERCGMDIPWEEISGEPFCDWCLHMMSKDD